MIKLIFNLVCFFSVSFALFAGEVINGSIEKRLSSEIEIHINENTKSFLIQAEAKGLEDQFFFISELTSPSGVVHVKSNVGTRGETYMPSFIYIPMRSSTRTHVIKGGIATLLYPNSDSVARVEPGKWKVKLGLGKDLKKKVNFTLKVTQRVSNEAKKITFNYHLPSEMSLTRMDDVVQVLARVEQFYLSKGIQVKFNKGSESAALGKLGLDEYLTKVTRKKSSQHELYFVENLQTRAKEFQGITGCIPGVETTVADRHCGVTVSIKKDMELNRQRLANVVAHELAHYFGLYHLVDDFMMFGKVLDPISDTNTDDGGDDDKNIMYKTNEVSDELDFTPGQIKVLLNNPLLFH